MKPGVFVLGRAWDVIIKSVCEFLAIDSKALMPFVGLGDDSCFSRMA
jgi:hypothetical protein